MNITTVAISELSSASESVFPLTTSGNVKSGTFVPRGIMLGGVSDMGSLMFRVTRGFWVNGSQFMVTANMIASKFEAGCITLNC